MLPLPHACSWKPSSCSARFVWALRRNIATGDVCLHALPALEPSPSKRRLSRQPTIKDIMKTSSVLLALLPGVLSAPSMNMDNALVERATAQETTDELLFRVTLPQFTARRSAKNPSTLDWTSDGCTSSPDNPFGFPFVPACNRHDFGYHNYRDQSRFTQSNKQRIDNNFKTDLYFQCQSTSVRAVCNALAEVYYAAVRAFGGGDATPGKRDEDFVKIYEEKLVVYNNLVKEYQDKGELPVL